MGATHICTMKINTHARNEWREQKRSDADDASDDDGHVDCDDKTERKMTREKKHQMKSKNLNAKQSGLVVCLCVM